MWWRGVNKSGMTEFFGLQKGFVSHPDVPLPSHAKIKAFYFFFGYILLYIPLLWTFRSLAWVHQCYLSEACGWFMSSQNNKSFCFLFVFLSSNMNHFLHKFNAIRLFSLCLWSECELCHLWFDCWCQQLPNVSQGVSQSKVSKAYIIVNSPTLIWILPCI